MKWIKKLFKKERKLEIKEEKEEDIEINGKWICAHCNDPIDPDFHGYTKPAGSSEYFHRVCWKSAKRKLNI